MTKELDIRMADAKRRAMELGVGSLSGTELLAVVLGTGAIADALDKSSDLVIARNGLVGIARLGILELAQSPGMGIAKAIQLNAAIELGRRIQRDAGELRQQIKSPADLAQLMLPQMGLLEQEEVHTTMLDTRNRIISSRMVYRGSLNSASIRLAELFKEAVRVNAASIIVLHNHPSLDPSPSQDDISCTREIVKAGKLLGVDVLDHLILAGSRWISLKEHGLGFET